MTAVIKFGGYWNKILRAERKKYVCGKQTTMTFGSYNTKLQDVKDYHLAITPWTYGSIPVISATLCGTSPQVFEVVKTDDQLQQLLPDEREDATLDYCKRKIKGRKKSFIGKQHHRQHEKSKGICC